MLPSGRPSLRLFLRLRNRDVDLFLDIADCFSIAIARVMLNRQSWRSRHMIYMHVLNSLMNMPSADILHTIACSTKLKTSFWIKMLMKGENHLQFTPFNTTLHLQSHIPDACFYNP